MANTNIELVGKFPEILRDGAEQIEGFMSHMVDDARAEEFEEAAILNPADIRLAPIVLDMEVVFLVGSHHETTGVEFPAVLQDHEFSFTLKMFGDDLIATTEKDKEYILSTREALYLMQLAQAASNNPDASAAKDFRIMDSVDGSWPKWVAQPPV